MSYIESICDDTFFRVGIITPLAATGDLFSVDNRLVNYIPIIDRNVYMVSFDGVTSAEKGIIHFRAKMKFRYKNGYAERFLFIKKTPQIPDELYDSINFDALFNNEIQTYSIIVPAIENFIQQPLNLIKHYYTDIKRNFATVVLEDFAVNGWRMTREQVNLNLEHALLAVKYLGNFHGICFALRDRDRHLYDQLVSLLKEARYATDTPHVDWHLMMKQSGNRILKATRQFQSGVSEEFLQKLCQLLEDPYAYGKHRVQPQEPMITLCHGDYLRNNIAFKYDDETELPTDVIMFDLQTMRSASPMIDLTTFLALSTFTEVRYKHFSEIFKAYHDDLVLAYTSFAERSLPKHLSFNSMMREYVRFLPYSLGTAASFLMSMIEPFNITSEELLTQQRAPEEIIEEAMNRGGEECDRELAHQTKEMYDLSRIYNVDIFEVSARTIKPETNTTNNDDIAAVTET